MIFAVIHFTVRIRPTQCLWFPLE